MFIIGFICGALIGAAAGAIIVGICAASRQVEGDDDWYGA